MYDHTRSGDESLESKFENISEVAGEKPREAIETYKEYFDKNVEAYRTPSRMAVRAAISIVEALEKKVAALSKKVGSGKKARKGDRLKTGGRTARRLSRR